MATLPIMLKAKEDAPGYALAASPATSCSTCEAFQMRHCTMYDFRADPAWTCDSWTRRKTTTSKEWPAKVPSAEQIPTLKEASSITQFTVFKDKEGRYRWILKSGNAFEDRDGEVVTTKALARDVARTDRTGEYGPLRWWHVGKPIWKNPMDWRSVVAGKGVDLGDCDFSAMSGPILLESGTFKSEAVGAAIAAKADQFRASLGFSHPLNEPDVDKLYHHINRFERSLTPANKASNLRTGLVVTKERTMDLDKLAEFKELVGEDIAQLAIGDAQTTTKGAREAGIREKGQSEGENETLDDLAAQLEQLSAGITAFKAQMTKVRAPAGATATNVSDEDNKPVVPDAITAKAVDGEPDGDEGGDEGDSEEVYVGDMTGSEFAAMLHQTLAPMFEPVHKSLDLHGKMQAMDDSMKEMKQYLGGLKTKDDTIAALKEQVTAMGITLKEAQDQLTDLTGDIPRELNKPRGTSYKASEGNDNLIQLDENQGEEQVHSPLSWIDAFVVQQQNEKGQQALQAPVINPPNLNGRVG